MDKRSSQSIAVLGGLTALWVLCSCNIFEPFVPKRDSTLDYAGLIIRGNDALEAGNFAQAESLYLEAQHKNPAGSEGYLFHAQAIVARYHLDFNKLQDEFDCKRSTRVLARCLAEGVDTSGVPFIDSLTTVQSIDSVFYPIATAVQDLNHILRYKTDTLFLDSAHKNFLPPDGDTGFGWRGFPGRGPLDLGLLLAINGVLAPLDLDGNLHVDTLCGVNIANDSVHRAVCDVGPNTDPLLGEKLRLANFIKLTENIHLDSLNSDDVNARDMSTNPNDINAFIASMQKPIAGSVYNLDSVNHALNNHNQTALSGEIQGAVSNVQDLSNFLGYMRYNDGIDDDFDRQLVANPTPMQWHNFDRDEGDPSGVYKNHGIRFDYDDGTDFNTYPFGSGDIGYPVHRFLHKNLYMTFSQWGAAYPALKADTSKNSRFALMRKECYDLVHGDSAGNVWVQNNIAALHLVCDSVTTVLVATVTPPAHSDWVGGTAGVDEEMIDQFDNDYDGIKDEDARNLVGFDDDDDALMTLAMVGTKPTPMQWHDVAGHANQCIDIDTTLPMILTPGLAGKDPIVDYHLRRQNCLGTLEHRLYLAKTSPDSLKVYYSQYVNATNYSNPDCESDYSKLDAAFITAWGATQGQVDTACHYKHIWIAPRPPQSEWTGGVYGIDEEKLDGVDNDGDGWIDEDVDVPTTHS